MSEKKSMKLKFKGDKAGKKHRVNHDGEPVRKRKREADDDGEHDLEWVNPEFPKEITGPTFIFHPSDPPVCIAYDQTRLKVSLPALSRVDPEGGPTPVPLIALTPREVSHVWVSNRVAGTETTTLRTPEGKFLSSDKHGLVSADREARGPQEEWTPVVLEDKMVAFQNMYDKYLAVDVVAGGALSLRADSDQVGFQERFWVKVQHGHKRKAGEEERKRAGVQDKPVKIDEAATNRIHQAWGAGRSIVSQEDKRELKKARKDGRLAEAMLERRAKLKSDRFC